MQNYENELHIMKKLKKKIKFSKSKIEKYNKLKLQKIQSLS